MSTSFFLKAVPKDKKRKRTAQAAKPKRSRDDDAPPPAKHDPNEEIDSDAEDDADAANAAGSGLPAFDFGDDDDDRETPQDKRLKLAKKYLAEIEQEERQRSDDQQLQQNVSTRLTEDYLDSIGRLRKNVADQLTVAPDGRSAVVLRSKWQKAPVTCVCVAADSSCLFVGSKTPVVVKWTLHGDRPQAAGTFDCTRTPSALEALAVAAKAKKSARKPARLHVCAMAMSTDGRFLAVADGGNLVHVWCPQTLKHLHTLTGHRDAVTALAFRRDTHTLFSAGADRSVKVWSLDEMAYIETLFGHQAPITSLDALNRERAITSGGFDGTVRIWKIAEESQLIYGGQKDGALIDQVRLINEENFLTASADGSLAVWSVMKKRPLCEQKFAHGRAEHNGQANWISAIATVVNSDVVASGSCDGVVRLWKLGDHYRTITALAEIPVVGFVNALAFLSNTSSLVIGSGQEHRNGRWWRIKEAKNAISIVRLREAEAAGPSK